MSGSVDLIKERLNIAEVIGSYIKLEKAGINLKARCPFHNEKTPSFSVSPSRGSFHCFGCGEGGDMFTFVEKFEGVDFKGALKILAERAGVPLVYERPREGEKEERDVLFEIIEEATRFFEGNLAKAEAPRKYLKGRGLTEKTTKEFRLGYVPLDWRLLLTHLRGKGFKDALIEKSGLIKKPDDGGGKDYYDRFRGRIMFPIGDASGRIVAFSGRIFDVPEKKGEVEPAKYINSPEMPLFSKSKVLYGYDHAKDGIRKWGFTIFVEGQMDLLMSHQAGFRNTVALSGTALTGEHLTLIGRLSEKLVLALDSDTAGIAASGKSAALALARGFDVKAARLLKGKDPAELVKDDPELWKKAVREASHIIEFYLNTLESESFPERKFRQEVSRLVIPYVAEIKSPIDRAHFANRVAGRLRLPEKAVIDEIDSYIKKHKEHRDGVREDNVPSGKENVATMTRVDMLVDRLMGLILAEEAGKKKKFDSNDVRKRVEGILGEEDFEKNLERATLSPTILFEGEEAYEQNEFMAEEVEELLLSLKYQVLKDSFEVLMKDLNGHERGGRSKETEELLKKCHEISKKMTEISLLLKN